MYKGRCESWAIIMILDPGRMYGYICIICVWETSHQPGGDYGFGWESCSYGYVTNICHAKIINTKGIGFPTSAFWQDLACLDARYVHVPINCMHLYCCTYQYVSCQFISLSLLSYSYRFRTPDTQLFFGRNSGGKNQHLGWRLRGNLIFVCILVYCLVHREYIHTDTDYGYRIIFYSYKLPTKTLRPTMTRVSGS